MLHMPSSQMVRIPLVWCVHEANIANTLIYTINVYDIKTIELL